MQKQKCADGRIYTCNPIRTKKSRIATWNFSYLLSGSIPAYSGHATRSGPVLLHRWEVASKFQIGEW